MSSPAGWWAGRSPITCVPSWSPTPWIWPDYGANPLARWFIRTAEPRQYTSWLFGHRLREAGLLGSMGRVASAFDNAMIESFFGSMQIELLDRRIWTTRAELATAIFEYIEAFYNPVRRHSALDYRSPIDYERHHTTTNTAA